MATVGRDGAAASTELVSRRADDTVFVSETTVSPIVDERGVHTHWLHVARDMTQRRGAEEAERRRRELSGFRADVATRALALGRDEVLDDVGEALATFGEILGVDLVYLDTIDRDAGVLVSRGGVGALRRSRRRAAERGRAARD